MTFSPESKRMMMCYLERFPWVRYISRSRPDLPHGAGALRLHEVAPEATESGGFCPAGRCVDLDSDLFPELPEGVCVSVEEVMKDERFDATPTLPLQKGGGTKEE